MGIVLRSCPGDYGAHEPGEEFTALFFYKDRSTKDGLSRLCVECTRRRRRKTATPEEAEATGRRSHLTEEQREAQRQRMNALVAQGRAGGPAFAKLGGRPKAPSLTELVLAGLQDKADMVLDALVDALTDDDKKLARDTAEKILNIEGRRDDREVRAFKALRTNDPLDGMSRQELIDTIVNGIVAMSAGELESGEIIDGEFADAA